MNKWRKPGELVHHQLPPRFCPSCFTMLDAVTALTGTKEMPEPGDYTVCIGCGSVLKYDDHMEFVMSSLMEIPMHSRLGFAQVVTEVKERGPYRGKRRP